MRDYATHTPYTDPGPYAELLDALPAQLPGLAAVVRNILVHYRSGVTLPAERLAEINNRWVERILATDQARHPAPLALPRALEDRVAGCCRDFTLVTVAALRQHGIPARSRIGFAGYFEQGFHHDHVIAEYWNGERWVWVDAQLDPAPHWGFDVHDLPRPADAAPFATAAQVWTALRRGEIDPWRYGVAPGLPIGGPWFIYDYVILELAHRMGEELLLWDGWGAMSGDFAAELSTADSGLLELADEIAALLLAADAGSADAEQQLATRYATDPRLHPAGRVVCHTPTGEEFGVDLETRKVEPFSPSDEIARATSEV
jgi:hypothetical protein